MKTRTAEAAEFRESMKLSFQHHYRDFDTMSSFIAVWFAFLKAFRKLK